jgi:hypothetical protein
MRVTCSPSLAAACAVSRRARAPAAAVPARAGEPRGQGAPDGLGLHAPPAGERRVPRLKTRTEGSLRRG